MVLINLCVTPPHHVPTCYLPITGWGFDCYLAYLSPNFTESIISGHALTSVCLWIIGLFNLVLFLKTYCRGGKSRAWLTLNVAIYTINTGFFAWFRGFVHLGRPLLVGAALHNWSEWFFICVIYVRSNSQKWIKFLYASIFIWGIILLVVLIPTFPYYAIVEQASGIVLDFLLPISYFAIYFKQQPKDRSLWIYPLIAHTTHLFHTIIPLVFGNYLVGQSSVITMIIEVQIYFSSVLTHILYTKWAWDYDRIVWRQPKTPDKNLTSGFYFRFIICFILGASVTIGYPLLVGECSSGPEVMATTDVTVCNECGEAFENRILAADYINIARNQPGNIHFDLYKRFDSPNEYRFIEYWSESKFLINWLNHSALKNTIRNNELMHKLWASPRYLQVQGAYNKINEILSPNYRLGAVPFHFGQNCDQVWSIISNWSNCEWEIGCTKAVLDPNNPDIRTITFQGREQRVQRTLNDENNYILKYTVINEGLSGKLSLQKNLQIKGCNGTYGFNISTKVFPDIDALYGQFYKVVIPSLEKLFAVK